MRPVALIAAVLCFAACGDEGGGVDAGASSDAAPSADAASAVDASIREDAAPTPDATSAPDAALAPDASDELVRLEHPRELRGVWVATVSNIDFPRAGAVDGQAALEAIVDVAASAGLNAIFFQVRPESDALYASAIEPWSRYLSGTQGQDPGYDPLASLIALAKRRHVEVHAWINPYRGLVSASAQTAPNHVTRELSAHAIRYGNGIVMDPSAPPVRARVLAVVRELAERYDIAGVHFDDYFYPYPDASNTPFPDDASYAAYTQGGGAMSLGDWRRDNVNALVREVGELVRGIDPTLRFGISPFGIYRNGVPMGIRGLDAYATIYCDGVKWMTEGWVDYLAPQLYWPTTQTAQAYGTLAAWWASTSTGGRHLFPGHALYRLGSGADWTIDEMRAQIEITRGLRDQGALGDLFFSYRQLASDLEGVQGLFRSLYARAAVAPQVPRALGLPAAPTLAARVGGLTIDHADRAALSGLLLYRADGGGFVLERPLAPDVVELNLAPGRWAISALGPGGVEGLGRAIDLP